MVLNKKMNYKKKKLIFKMRRNKNIIILMKWKIIKRINKKKIILWN